MSYHDHAQPFRPARMRPVVYRTRTPLWRKVLPWLVAGLFLAGLVLATVALIHRVHVTDATLERVHAAGFMTGMRFCARGR